MVEVFFKLTDRSGRSVATRHRSVACLSPWALTVVLCVALVGQADEIRLGGFWISDVSVQGIEGDQVLYFNRMGTEFIRPIQSVEGLKIEAYPQLAEAVEAINAGDDHAARRALEHVRSRTGARWLRQWVSHLLIDVYDRLGMPGEAVDLFLQLAAESAPAFYLDHPPRNALAEADIDVQKSLRQRVSLAAQNLAGQPRAPHVRKLLGLFDPGAGPESTGGVAVTAVTEVVPGGDPGANPLDNSADGDAARPRHQVVLSGELGMADTVTQLLVHQRFEQALEEVDKVLAKDDQQLAMRLYQRGLAQLYIAEASGEDKQYHDAGLSFMSVLAYFPQSTFVAPSMVEAGVVHSKIGQPEVARSLYERASLMIDAQEEPRYADRLKQQMDGLADR